MRRATYGNEGRNPSQGSLNLGRGWRDTARSRPEQDAALGEYRARPEPHYGAALMFLLIPTALEVRGAEEGTQRELTLRREEVRLWRVGTTPMVARNVQAWTAPRYDIASDPEVVALGQTMTVDGKTSEGTVFHSYLAWREDAVPRALFDWMAGAQLAPLPTIEREAPPDESPDDAALIWERWRERETERAAEQARRDALDAAARAMRLRHVGTRSYARRFVRAAHKQAGL